MKVEQSAAQRGSQRWLQIAVNRCPEVINSTIVNELGLCSSEKIEWLSPLECDGFVEYRDEQFIKRLGESLDKRPLKDFWPNSGPRWDGLALTSSGCLLLLEAKANIPEFDTNPTGATGTSLKENQGGADGDQGVSGCQVLNGLVAMLLPIHQQASAPLPTEEIKQTQCLSSVRLFRKRPDGP